MVQNAEQKHTHVSFGCGCGIGSSALYSGARLHTDRQLKNCGCLLSGDGYSEVEGCHTSKIYKEIKVTSSVVLVISFCQKPSSTMKKSVYLQVANTALTIFLNWSMPLIAQVVVSNKQLKGSRETSQLEAQKRSILYQGNLQMLQINFLSPQQSFRKCQPCC